MPVGNGPARILGLMMMNNFILFFMLVEFSFSKNNIPKFSLLLCNSTAYLNCL
jgi:hypothetical protein